MPQSVGYSHYYLYRQKNTTGNMKMSDTQKPGKKEGIYNILIMEEMVTIVALGARGHGQRRYIQTV